MDTNFINENAHELERLRALVNKLTKEELLLPLYKEGWTIASALAHLAFWDQRALMLMKKWGKSDVTESPIDTDLTNDTLLPFFLAIPPKISAQLAVSCAEAIDRELENASPELIQKIEMLHEKHRLNRHIHRKMHIDEIQLFIEKRTKSGNM
jgi:hypothetical protein